MVVHLHAVRYTFFLNNRHGFTRQFFYGAYPKYEFGFQNCTTIAKSNSQVLQPKTAASENGNNYDSMLDELGLNSTPNVK